MEASTLQAPAGLARRRIAIGIPLLRLRSDEQLVALFRAGHDEAFRVIHDRYEKRLLGYTRQMLPRSQDAEDALQDVFVRAYAGLRSSQRELALRAWLFRVAHNRCIDELRRPSPPAPEFLQLTGGTIHDPVAEAEGRESLRRLIIDVRRLPEQQRSALLMREMGGMSYTELACTLGTSVPAVKSLLVRARLALAQAAEARDTACSDIREELVGAHDRGVRPNATAKRHMHDCSGCRSFRRELRSLNRRLAALAPLGPIGLLAKTLGFSSGAGASSGATASGAGGSVAAFGGAAGSGGAVASGAIVVGSGHVATLLAAAVATAGGAVVISAPPAQPKYSQPAAKIQSAGALPVQPGASTSQPVVDTDAAAVAVGVSLITQSKEATAAASQTTKAPRRHKVVHAAPPPSAPPDEMAPPSVSSPSQAAPPPAASPSPSTATTLTPGSEETTGTAVSAGTTSTTSSTGTGSQTTSSTGSSSSTSGSDSSGTTSSGSSTSGSTGTTSNTTNGGSTGTATGSGSGSTSTGTSTDSGSGSGTSQSSSGTSTPSK